MIENIIKAKAVSLKEKNYKILARLIKKDTNNIRE